MFAAPGRPRADAPRQGPGVWLMTPTETIAFVVLVLGAVALAMWVGDLPHAANAEAGRLSQAQPETGPVNEPSVVFLPRQARHLVL
jgi:hypothetical protein